MTSNQSSNPAVRLLAVEEMPAAPSRRLKAEQPQPTQILPSPQPTPASSGPTNLDLTIAVLKAAGFALSARALLLLALVGAFVLTLQAMSSQTPASMEILAIYGVFAILPVAYLETRRGRS